METNKKFIGWKISLKNFSLKMEKLKNLLEKFQFDGQWKKLEWSVKKFQAEEM